MPVRDLQALCLLETLTGVPAPPNNCSPNWVFSGVNDPCNFQQHWDSTARFRLEMPFHFSSFLHQVTQIGIQGKKLQLTPKTKSFFFLKVKLKCCQPLHLPAALKDPKSVKALRAL